MNKLCDSLFKYGLHDTSISNIGIEDFVLSLRFDEGVYLLDSANKETVKTDKIILKFYIEKFASESVFQHLDCRFFKRRKVVYVTIDEFINKINRQYNEINNVFYSGFNDIVVMNGRFDNCEYEFIVENVERIEFENA